MTNIEKFTSNISIEDLAMMLDGYCDSKDSCTLCYLRDLGFCIDGSLEEVEQWAFREADYE